MSDDRWSTSAAFVDYDRDGHLDLFVANYLDFSFAGNRRCVDPVGAPDYCSPRVYRPVPDRLYRNLGNGRFADVTESAGIAKADGAGLGVAAGDYNRDGWPDLYVANDATPNQLWINRRDGTFADDGVLAGAAFNAAGNPEGSMGIASGDFDLDGDEDLLITNLVGETFVLYENDGAGAFTDVRTRTGLAAPTASMTGFGTDWLDYDNDGWLDVFFANGAVNTIAAQRGRAAAVQDEEPVVPEPRRQAVRGRQRERGPGVRRARRRPRRRLRRRRQRRRRRHRRHQQRRTGQAAAESGERRESLAADRSRAAGAESAGDWRIRRGRANRSLGFARDRPLDFARDRPLDFARDRPLDFARDRPLGFARDRPPTLWRRVRTDGSYLSASSPRLHFGLGASPAVDAVVVEWPDGQRERWTKPGINRVVTLKRGSGERRQ